MSGTQAILGMLTIVSGGFGIHNWIVAGAAQIRSGRRSRLCMEAKWRRKISIAFFLVAMAIPVAAWLLKIE